MIPVLEKALAGADGEPIRVDIDALWQKAIDQVHDQKRKAQHDAVQSPDDLGAFAVISSWARGKSKKG